MISFPFYHLPQDIIDHVAANVVASIPDVARLDSATCCASSRPMLLHSMRAVHNTHLLLGRDNTYGHIGRWRGDDTKNIRSSLDWIVSRRFAISKLTLCPFGISSWKPDAEYEGIQIVVKKLEVLMDGFTNDPVLPQDAWWSQFRWAELEWSRLNSDFRSISIIRCFSESQVPLLPVDRLTRVNFRGGVLALDHPPRCLMSGYLRNITATTMDDNLQHWIHIIEGNRATLEELDISLKSSVGHESDFDDSVLAGSWPALVSISLSGDGSAAAAINRLMSVLVEGAVEVHELSLHCATITSEAFVALLKYVIWRPRNQTVEISLYGCRTIAHPLLGSWVTNNPGETLWSGSFDFIVHELWRYLPTERQLFDMIVRNSPFPKHVPAICLRRACEVCLEFCPLTELHWRALLSSPRLYMIEVSGFLDDFVNVMETLCQEAGAGIAVPEHSVYRVYFESKGRYYTDVLLTQLTTLFSHTLENVNIVGVRVSFESMIQFARNCRRLDWLRIDFVDMPANFVMTSTSESMQRTKRKRPRATIECDFSLLWPVDYKYAVPWEDFYETSKTKELVWNAVVNTFKHYIFAGDYSSPNSMKLALRFCENSSEGAADAKFEGVFHE